MMAKVKPQNTLRFAWWGAEELGLIGSTAYVDGLSQAERDRIAMYMNYDMVGSPNYIFMVYDADESTLRGAGRRRPGGLDGDRGSVRVVLHARSASRTTTRSSPAGATTRRSSRPAFRPAACSPAPRSIKTAEQQAIWGGTAGAQFDPCYHLACDTFANNNDHALEVNSDLIAYAQLTFAFSTESVNGVAGKRARLGVEPAAGTGRRRGHVRLET